MQMNYEPDSTGGLNDRLRNTHFIFVGGKCLEGNHVPGLLHIGLVRPCPSVTYVAHRHQPLKSNQVHLDSVQKSKNPHLHVLPGLANRVDANAVDDSTH